MPMVNIRDANRPRSTRGDATRSSVATNNPRLSAASSVTPISAGLVHPQSLPKVSARRNSATDGPSNSGARPVEALPAIAILDRRRGRQDQPAKDGANQPKGTAMKNTQRQPSESIRNPPTDGPTDRPMAWAAPWTPMARPSRRRADGGGDDRHAVSLQHGRAHCLEHTEDDQPAQARCKAAQR